MDTVTQIALGAAVGEATLGRKVGWRAQLWGGLCGLLPDLDVLWPFADAVSAFTWHRGYTHSIAVIALATPLVAWAAVRIHPDTRPFLRGWLLLAFLALVTHPLLDCFTVYGTQVLLPFSDLPVAWSTVFIIDPAFTVPVALGVLAAQVLSRERGLGHPAPTIRPFASTPSILASNRSPYWFFPVHVPSNFSMCRAGLVAHPL